MSNSIDASIRSMPTLMRYFPSLHTYAMYRYTGNVYKLNSLVNLFNSITDCDMLFSFIEIRGNGACLYNAVITCIMLHQMGVSVGHLLCELQPHDDIPLTNSYNQKVIEYIDASYWIVNSGLESYGIELLSSLIGPDFGEITDYEFTKSLNESIQNFQQLGGLLARIFDIVIISLNFNINGNTSDSLSYTCVTPNRSSDIDEIKHHVLEKRWKVIYLVNMSTHYNVVIPHMSDSNLLMNEFNLFFNRIAHLLTFV